MSNTTSQIITDNGEVWEAAADSIMSEILKFPIAGQVEVLRIVSLKMGEEVKRRQSEYVELMNAVDELKTK